MRLGIFQRVFKGGFLLVAFLGGCGDVSTDPKIEKILPSQGRTGEAVDIIGESFDEKKEFSSFTELPGSVYFGGISGKVDIWQDRRIRVRIPQGPHGQSIVVVLVEGKPSNGESFFIEGFEGDGGLGEGK